MYTTKSIDFSIKDISEQDRIVQFYICKFGTPDLHNDIFHPDSMTFNLALLKHFKNHNPSHLIGVIKEVVQDTNGYYVTSQLLPNTIGKDTIVEYAYGAINQHSIGGYIRDGYKDGDYFNITKFELYEVSSLTHWAAQPATEVISFKDRGSKKHFYLEYLKNII